MHSNEPQTCFMVDQSGKSVRVIQNPISYKSYDASHIINSQQNQYVRPINKPISIQRYGFFKQFFNKNSLERNKIMVRIRVLF